jgi:hypothetical protein
VSTPWTKPSPYLRVHAYSRTTSRGPMDIRNTSATPKVTIPVDPSIPTEEGACYQRCLRSHGGTVSLGPVWRITQWPTEPRGKFSRLLLQCKAADIGRASQTGCPSPFLNPLDRENHVDGDTFISIHRESTRTFPDLHKEIFWIHLSRKTKGTRWAESKPTMRK